MPPVLMGTWATCSIELWLRDSPGMLAGLVSCLVGQHPTAPGVGSGRFFQFEGRCYLLSSFAMGEGKPSGPTLDLTGWVYGLDSHALCGGL